MICSECRKTYRGRPGEVVERGTIAGFCEDCGTQRKYGSFLRGFTNGLFGMLLSFELLAIVYLGSKWQSLVIALGVAVVAYLAVRTAVIRAGEVRYYSENEKKQKTRGQFITGLVVGVVAGGTVFSLIVTAL